MSECRAITNLIGNGVATLVVARWESELDMSRLRAVLTHEPGGEADETPQALMNAEPIDHVLGAPTGSDGSERRRERQGSEVARP